MDPLKYDFIYFRNLEAILIQPSKQTALKYLEPIERQFQELASRDGGTPDKIDRQEIEGRALRWENAVVVIFKPKRATWWAFPVKEIKYLSKFVGLVRPQAEKHGVKVIDESRLPSGTGEKIRPD